MYFVNETYERAFESPIFVLHLHLLYEEVNCQYYKYLILYQVSSRIYKNIEVGLRFLLG